MRLEHKVVMLLSMLASPAWANSLSAEVNNSTAQFEGGIAAAGSPAEYRAGVFYNDQGTVLLNAGLLAGGGDGGEEAAGKPAIRGGAKAIMGRMNQGGVKDDMGCIAIGGQIGFALPAATSAGLVAGFYNSLKMSSFGNTNHYSQLDVRIELGSDGAKFLLGYREITINFINSGILAVDRGNYAGVNFSF